MFQGADPDSIRRSYRRLASKWHPDKHRGADYADAFTVNLCLRDVFIIILPYCYCLFIIRLLPKNHSCLVLKMPLTLISFVQNTYIMAAFSAVCLACNRALEHNW